MREDILQLLINSDTPLYLAEIADKMKETSQLTQYHLNRLVGDGVLLTYVEDRKRYYVLQPVQYKYPPSSLYSLVMPLLEDMAELIQCDQTHETPQRIMSNNLILLLERFTVEIDELFDNDDVNDSDEDNV